MLYLFSRTDITIYTNKYTCMEIKPVVTKNDTIKGVVVTGLEPSLCARFT